MAEIHTRPICKTARTGGLILATALSVALLLGALLPALTPAGAQDATFLPGWDRMGSAASDAARAPETWLPLAAALLLQINDADQRLSRWAIEQTPVYGSSHNARLASDHLQLGATIVYGVTVLAAPVQGAESRWIAAKAHSLVVGIAARTATYEVVHNLKLAADRIRPDESDDLSFPSGHASGAAVFATLAARNVETLPVSARMRTAGRVLCAATAIGCAWARVEGEKHYPADVLTGLAIGHFIGAFFNDAFLGRAHHTAITFSLSPIGGWTGAAVQVGMRF